MENRLLIITSDPEQRTWLTDLCLAANYKVVGSGHDIPSAFLSSLHSQTATVAIIQLQDGVVATASFWIELSVVFPDTKIICVLAGTLNETAMIYALQAGVYCFVWWNDIADNLHDILQATMQGRRYYSDAKLIATATRLIKDVETGAVQVSVTRLSIDSVSADLLNARDLELLVLVGQGLSNRRIAHQLSLSEKTVRNYLTQIFHKLNFKNRTEAAIWINTFYRNQ